MAADIDDIGYGKQFDGWYDRLFQETNAAEATAEALAGIHPDPALGTLEFGVGTGRIAFPLARRIGTVEGVDSSPEMLSTLADTGGAHDGDVLAIHGDIRTYKADHQYGLIYIVCGTLNQVLNREEQRSVIQRAAELLAPGGRLVIESHNRTAVERLHGDQRQIDFFTPYPEPRTGLHTHAVLDLEHALWKCLQTWHEQDGSTRTGTEYSRLLAAPEVHDLADAVGLLRVCPESGFGGWDMTPATEASPTFIAVYER